MTDGLIDRNPEILGGTPVFSGTRVPVRILMEYLEAGDRLDEFLEDYPPLYREARQSRYWNARRVCWYPIQMKLLLDESVPRRLSSFFPEPFTVSTVVTPGAWVKEVD